MIAIVPVEGLPEIEAGADLAALIAERTRLEDGDVVVVAQKAVSKTEGRVVRIADVEASDRARELAGGRDPRELEVVLREAARIVRARPPFLIAETRHGFVCASAGVDHSNAPEAGTVVLLPLDPDASARRIRHLPTRREAPYLQRNRSRSGPITSSAAEPSPPVETPRTTTTGTPSCFPRARSAAAASSSAIATREERRT